MNITPFNFHNNDIRVIQDDNGEPWFIAKDICNILGYVNHSQAIDDNCKLSGISVRYIPSLSNNYTLINEGNLYRLILKSNKPEAESLESFVCDEVLPSIRKTGAYAIQKPLTALELAKGQVVLHERIEKLEEQAKLDAPKVKFAETITESSNTRCIRVWVKTMKSDHSLKVGEREVFKWLRKEKYIFKDGNLPYSKYESNGLSYFSLAAVEDDRGIVRQSLQITGKGMVALTQKVIEHFSDVEVGYEQ